MYADDTNVSFSACVFSELQRQMKKDLEHLESWLIANKLTLNMVKTEYMVVGSKQRINSLVGDLTLSLNDISLRKVKSTKCLGVTIDKFLTWAEHIDNVIKKLVVVISLLRRNRKVLKKCDLMNVYRAIVEPYFDYCCIIWDGISDYLALKLQKLQNRAARIITGADYLRRSSDILNKLGWEKLSERRQKCKAVMMHKIIKILNHKAPLCFLGLFRPETGANFYDLRSSTKNVELPFIRTEYYKRGFVYSGAKVWNSLPEVLKKESSLKRFKELLKNINFSADH
jgi:hypothetical protein